MSFRLVSVALDPAALAADVLDPLGAPIADLSTAASVSDGAVLHWLDAPLAAAIVPAARAALTAATAPGKTDTQRRNALGEAAQWCAEYCNALNIVWWNNPVWRAAYRRYVAGPPRLLAGSYSEALFAATTSYSSLFSAARPFMQGTAFGGLIPRSAWAEVQPRLTGGAHPGQFLEGILLGLAPTLSGDESDVDAANLAAHPEVAASCRNIAAEPYWGESLAHGLRPDGVTQDDAAIGWNSARFDSEWTVLDDAVPERFCAPLSAWVGYLDALVSDMEARGAERVVASARAFVAWCNYKTIAAAGGIGALIHQTNAAIDQATAPDPKAVTYLRVAGTSAAALGAAFAPVTFGISGVIGGAVGAVLTVGAAAVPPDLSRVYVDDVHIIKPVFERAWLSGDPADATATGVPNHAVRLPPGYAEAPAAARAVAPAATRFAHVGGGAGSLAALAAAAAQALSNVQPETPTGSGVQAFSLARLSAGELFGIAGALGVGAYLIARRMRSR